MHLQIRTCSQSLCKCEVFLFNGSAHYFCRVNQCPSCQTKFPICIVTGRPLMDLSSVWTCENCHHRAYEQDITMKQNCPLCHVPINL